MAELIKTTDSLNDGRKKLNDAITDSNAALSTANTAKQTANLAKAESESTQTQLDTIVIEGDSSVEAAQARVNNSGTAFPTLKQRLDAEHQEVTAQLQLKANINYVNDFLSDLSSATPDGYYPSLIALETAFPNGSDTPKLVDVQNEAHVFIYTGTTWQNVGVYQQNVLQPESVNYNHIDAQSQSTLLGATIPFNLEMGTISPSTGLSSDVIPTRIRSNLMTVDVGDKLILDTPNFVVTVFYYDVNKQFETTSAFSGNMRISKKGYMRVVFSPHPDRDLNISQEINSLYNLFRILRKKMV